MLKHEKYIDENCKVILFEFEDLTSVEFLLFDSNSEPCEDIISVLLNVKDKNLRLKEVKTNILAMRELEKIEHKFKTTEVHRDICQILYNYPLLIEKDNQLFLCFDIEEDEILLEYNLCGVFLDTNEQMKPKFFEKMDNMIITSMNEYSLEKSKFKSLNFYN